MKDGNKNTELEQLRFRVLSSNKPSPEDVRRLNELIDETGEAEEIELDEE